MASACGPEAGVVDDFQVVQYKKGKRRVKRVDSRPGVSCNMVDDSHIDLESLQRRIYTCRNELLASDFYKSLLNTLDTAIDAVKNGTHNITTACTSVQPVGSPTGNPDGAPSMDGRKSIEHNREMNQRQSDLETDVSMLVYGLGNIASCAIARYQLALVLALREHWQVETAKCEAYDPKFSETEKKLLQDLGCSIIQQNEEGKRLVEGVTVVFMPHCGKALFNNLLWANWSPRQLQQMVVMGNSFSNMVDSIPQRLAEKHINYVAMISPHCREEIVQNTLTHTDIFNDLSVHWFPPSRLLQLPPDTWSQAPEPVYNTADLEIIVNSSS